MKIVPIMLVIFVSAVAWAVAACSSVPAPAPVAAAAPLARVSTVPRASVNLAAASGSLVSGRLLLRPMGDGVQLTGEIGGLAPGSVHAIHLHENGDCSAADASSAGGHFNPTSQPHGKVDSPAHHLGDMNNIVASADGVATVDVTARGVVLGGGAANDAIGRAVVVHAQADDYTSQPSGAAGARVACGVITAGG